MVEISKIMSFTNSINFTLITQDGFPISKKKKKKKQLLSSCINFQLQKVPFIASYYTFNRKYVFPNREIDGFFFIIFFFNQTSQIAI